MPSERDLFANFERMRREMDELFGDVFERAGFSTHGRGGFSPRVDVYYCGDPPRAVVKAELPGVEAGDVGIEVRGRELVISGRRRAAESEGRVYQQLEIEHGPFRRVVQLGGEVRVEEARAAYEEGVLTVELPLAQPAALVRRVPIATPETEGSS